MHLACCMQRRHLFLHPASLILAVSRHSSTVCDQLDIIGWLEYFGLPCSHVSSRWTQASIREHDRMQGERESYYKTRHLD